MRHLFLILLLFSVTIPAQLPKIAVLDLTSKSLQKSDIKAITDKLTQEIYKTGYYDLIERSNIEKVFEEHELSQSGIIDENDAVELGKIAGVQKILLGSVEKTENVYAVNIRLVNVVNARIESMVSYEHDGKIKKLIKKGVAEIVKELTGKELGLKRIEVEFSFIAVREGKSFSVKSGDTLKTGDRIHITVKPNQRCYVYMINQDAKGDVYSLFPNPSQRYMALEAGVEYRIPSKGMSFELNENTGKEHIYITASQTPMNDIEQLILKGKNKITEKDKLLETIATRGLAKVVKGNETVIELENGLSFNCITDILSGSGAFRYEVVFEHTER